MFVSQMLMLFIFVLVGIFFSIVLLRIIIPIDVMFLKRLVFWLPHLLLYTVVSFRMIRICLFVSRLVVFFLMLLFVVFFFSFSIRPIL